jgi:uncharacterized NAD-dependent epimerase/dehydratase family protein
MPRLNYLRPDRNELLFDPEINVIVEVINETEAAFEIVTTALKNGKDVVSSSKKMLAENMPELLGLQKQTNLLFYMKQPPAHQFLLSGTWKNIMITTCAIGKRQLQMVLRILFSQKCLKINWNSNKPYYWHNNPVLLKLIPPLM